jgi:hypothetical protein
MTDKVEELIQMKMRKKISYYISPLSLKIMVLLIILIAGGLNLHA